MYASAGDVRQSGQRLSIEVNSSNRTHHSRTGETPRGRANDAQWSLQTNLAENQPMEGGSSVPQTRIESRRSPSAQLATPRGRIAAIAPRGDQPHAQQIQGANDGPPAEASVRINTQQAGGHPPRGPPIPPLRLNQSDNGGGRLPLCTPRGRNNAAPRGALTERSAHWHTNSNNKNGTELAHNSQGANETHPQTRLNNNGSDGKKEGGIKRAAHTNADFPALSEMCDQVVRKRGVAWKKQYPRRNSTDSRFEAMPQQQQQSRRSSTESHSEVLLQQQRQENAVLQVKVSEARATMGSMLSSKLLDVVSENERLNRQLHGLHTSAAALRQAIADARSLQMHLQQEAADARLLAVGLQAQLRDAKVSSGAAAEDSAAVRAEGARLVRDSASIFGLTASDVFGSSQVDRPTQQALSIHTLDARSLSLMQNTQALLGPSVSTYSSHSKPTAQPVTTAAQPLKFGSFSPVAKARPQMQQQGRHPQEQCSEEFSREGPTARQLTISCVGSNGEHGKSESSPKNYVTGQMANMGLQQPTTNAVATTPQEKVAFGSCGLESMSLASTPDSFTSSTTNITSRIASLQVKFAAAEKLFEGSLLTAR